MEFSIKKIRFQILGLNMFFITLVVVVVEIAVNEISVFIENLV